MKGTVLLLAPQSEYKTGRVRAVQEALERKGFEVERLGAQLKPQWRRQDLYPPTVVRRQIQQADRVVVLPRADGTIGNGTLRDIELARELATSVFVVRNDGQLVPIREVSLVQLGDGMRNAARGEWAPVLAGARR